MAFLNGQAREPACEPAIHCRPWEDTDRWIETKARSTPLDGARRKGTTAECSRARQREPSRRRGVGSGRRWTVGSQSEGHGSVRSDGADRMGGVQFS